MVLIIRFDGERLADNAPGLDPDCRRKDAGKVGMQRAAAVGQISAAVAPMMAFSFVVVLMMVVSGNRVGNGLRAGARRRNDARELRDDKQGDQQPDKPS